MARVIKASSHSPKKSSSSNKKKNIAKSTKAPAAKKTKTPAAKPNPKTIVPKPIAKKLKVAAKAATLTAVKQTQPTKALKPAKNP